MPFEVKFLLLNVIYLNVQLETKKTKTNKQNKELKRTHVHVNSHTE